MRGFKTIAVLLALLVMSACSTVKLDEKAPVEDRASKSVEKAPAPAPAAAPMTAQPAPAAIDATPTKAADPLNDATGMLAKRSIYFDLDSYVIKDEFKSVIEAHAKYLVSRGDRKVILQGNTDERGGSEYNLALGQKRAEAVRKALSLAGVGEQQMEAVSFGKEKPKAMGSDESAWSQNRRTDIAY